VVLLVLAVVVHSTTNKIYIGIHIGRLLPVTTTTTAHTAMAGGPTS